MKNILHQMKQTNNKKNLLFYLLHGKTLSYGYLFVHNHCRVSEIIICTSSVVK